MKNVNFFGILAKTDFLLRFKLASVINSRAEKLIKKGRWALREFFKRKIEKRNG